MIRLIGRGLFKPFNSKPFDSKSFKSSVLLFCCALVWLSYLPLALAQDSLAPSSQPAGTTLSVSIEFSDSGLKKFEPRLRTLLEEAFSEYVGLFGGMPKSKDGSDYTQLKLKVSQGMGGEADPEYIELRINDTKLFGFYSWEMTLLHEVFHLWSAETFRYSSDREQWFNEGATEYYTFKLAVKLGIISQQEVASRFLFPVGSYLSAQGLTKTSMSLAPLVDGGKRDHYFLIYHGGLVAAMVLDYQIRANSNNIFSLDYLMRELYLSKSRENRYTNQTLVELIDSSTGFKAKSFFDRYIEGKQIIPVGRYLDLGLLEFRLKAPEAQKLKRDRILESMLEISAQ